MAGLHVADVALGLVVLFGIGNLGSLRWAILGPVVAKADLGGAGAWATILAVGGSARSSAASSRCGSGPPAARRLHARRVPLAGQRSSRPGAVGLAALRGGVLAGAGIAVHLTLWFTVFQREIPETSQSRVSSYDVLGSFVLMPIGFALVGPSPTRSASRDAVALARA